MGPLDRLAWLMQVATDAHLDSSASRLAVVLAFHVNSKRGDAWPSLKALADELHMSERTVIRLVPKLEAAGHLEVVRGGGRELSNVYRPILRRKTMTPATGFAAENTDSERSETLTNGVGNSDTWCHPNKGKNQGIKNRGARSRAHADRSSRGYRGLANALASTIRGDHDN